MLRILPLQLKLGKQMALADTVMTVTAQDAGTLNARLAVGDHMYFTLMDVRGDEVVRYDHTAIIIPVQGYATLPVMRASLTTAAKSWPAGQCLLVLNTEGVLREFICENMGAC